MSDADHTITVTERSQVRRARERGRYDRGYINQVLDRSVLCHLGYLDGKHPVVTPTVHWRIDDYLYWHGAKAARYMHASQNAEVCVTVTHLDGLVLARSAFHHSANYRSVMIFGRAQPVHDRDHKEAALKAMIEKFYPDRWHYLRPMTAGEFEGTAVVRVAIDEASAKVRSGPPVDDEADYQLPIWAGVVPVSQQFGEPLADPRQPADAKAPAHAVDLGTRLD